MKVLVAGDFCDKNRVKTAISEENYSLMFDGIKDVVKQADVRIVNFEFPIVEKEAKPIKKCGPNLIGQKKAIDAIKYAGFNVCTLANNHILDQGEECCINTKHLLEDAGIQTVGVGDNLQDAAKVLYIEQGDETIAIINCCENEFSIATNETPGSYPLNPVKQYHQIQEAKNKADYVIVITHGGHEHFNLPSHRMKELYHFYIEVGADGVVNHHQHCYSGFELYNGKPIFYGLGNLLFDNPNYNNSFWNIGYMVILNLNEGKIDYKLCPYTQCNENPNVVLLDSFQSQIFDKEISELNEKILDDSLLNLRVEEYYTRDSNYELSLLEPYQGRVFSKLFSLGLLPHFISGSKKTTILNHINCESHRDKLIYALTKKNK